MYAKLFIGFFFVLLSGTCGECGLSKWFNEWTDQLEPRNQDFTNCMRERRQTENGINNEQRQQEIVDPSPLPPTNGMVSLADVEGGKLDATETEQEGKTITWGNPKSKRCPKIGYVGNSFSGSAQPTALALRKEIIKTEEDILCETCLNQFSCNVLKKCESCYEYCKFNDDPGLASPKDHRSDLNLQSRHQFGFKTFPVTTFTAGETKDIIARLAGISNIHDIESLQVWVSTHSNKPPHMIGESNRNNGQIYQKTLDEAKQSMKNPQLKSRFNDYDSGEDPTISNLRSIDGNIKENPDIIEGPPPFLRSSLNKDDTVGNPKDETPKKQIIVQPKEFQSDESKEDYDVKPISKTPLEIGNRLKTKDPINGVASSNVPPKKGGFFSKLFAAKENFVEPKTVLSITDKPEVDGMNNMSEINQALQEVKAMVKSIQESAHKSSEDRLLGAQSQTSTVVPVFQTVPPHVVDNLHDVNKYLVHRAQDALDTVGEQEVNPPRDDYSENTKKVLTDLKKMPQFLLKKAKDVLNGFENKLKPKPDTALDHLEAQHLPDVINEESDVLKSTADQLKEDPLVELPSSDLEVTTKAYKNKLEKYMDELKKRRQNQYSLDKKQISQNPLESRFALLTTERPKIDTLATTIQEDSMASKLLKTSLDLDKQRDALRNKLKEYTDKLVTKKTNEPLKNGFKTMEQTSVKSILEQTSKQPEAVVGASNLEPAEPLIPVLQSLNFNKPLLPPVADNTIGSNKFMDALKPKPFARSNIPMPIVENLKAFNTNGFEPGLLKAKMQQYLNNLKKPFDTNGIQSQIARANSDIKHLVDTENLKNAIGNQMKFMKNPLENSLNPPTEVQKMLNFGRKSSETQKNELNNLKNKLYNMVQDQINKTPIIGNAHSEGTTIGAKPDEPETKTDDSTLGAIQLNTEVDIENRDQLKNNKSIQWSKSLGQIVQSSSKPHDIFFMGKNIKLPLKMAQAQDGTLDLSVDLDKLCSCQNTTCPRDHAAIEETVEAILEKEAELEEQLSDLPPHRPKRQNTASLQNIDLNSQKQLLNDAIYDFQNNAANVNKQLSKFLGQPLTGDLQRGIKTEMNKLQQQAKLLNGPGMRTPSQYLKKFERDRAYKKLLNQLGNQIDPLNMQTFGAKSIGNVLQSQLEKVTNFKPYDFDDTIFQQNNAAVRNLEEDIQNTLQYPQVNALKNRLQLLTNEVDKYDVSNLKLLEKETKSLVKNHPNKVVEKEVDLIGKLLNWLYHLGSEKDSTPEIKTNEMKNVKKLVYE